MKSLFALFVLAFAFSAVFVPLCIWIFRKLGKLDQPGDRKLHKVAVPRSGGLAIFLAYICAVALLGLLPASANLIFERYANFLMRLLPAIGIVLATGLADDWLDLSPRKKLAGQFLACCLAYSVGIRLFDSPEWYGIFSFPLTAFWLILCANAFNLIDGTDGLAATLGIVGCAGLIAVSLLLDYYPLAVVISPLLGAIVPFLRANWPPARVFMGDAGSLSIGFLLGCGGCVLAVKRPDGGGLIAAFLLVTLPIVEVALSSARRLLRMRSIFSADCNHIHHELKRQGNSSTQLLFRLGLLAVFGTTVAIIQLELSPLERFLLCAAFLGFLAKALAGLRYPEFSTLYRALSTGAARVWLRQQIELSTLEADLKAAQTPEAAWHRLQSYGQAIGFREMKVRLCGQCWDYQRIVDGENSTWVIRIDLPLKGYVNVAVSNPDIPVGDFAAIVLRTFNSKRLLELQKLTELSLAPPHPPEEALVWDRSA
jgi:UDP-GlcNAc:undecaprenyl-phosphate/decaprenyl-phosphate GlcNAc-1-phosphate transferase